jgi:sugar phosphate isomerase/epimerase
MDRREFLIAAAAAAPLAAASPGKPDLCLFSKHLPKLGYNDLGKACKQFGFDGVDLTVRAAGHVLPERVSEDLPRAVEAIRSHGLSVPMITTNLLSASETVARPTLSTAARLKVPYFKIGYYRYKGPDLEQTLAQVKRDTRTLVELGKEYGIQAGFHNHSGDYVGTAVWDTREIIRDLDPKWIGYYFDPCHATSEGGVYGGVLSARIALRNLKMVALKDFYWNKVNGRWRTQMCPLGEGMVDWPRFFKMLAESKFTGPLSLHVEYDPPDEMAAIARDLEFLKSQVAKAYA